MFGVAVFLYLKKSFLYHIWGTNIVPFKYKIYIIWHPKNIYDIAPSVEPCMTIILCVRDSTALPFRLSSPHSAPPILAIPHSIPTLLLGPHKIMVSHGFALDAIP